MTSTARLIIDRSLVAVYSGMFGLWVSVCGFPGARAAIASVGVSAVSLVGGSRVKTLVACVTLAYVEVELLRIDAPAAAVLGAFIGVGAVLAVMWTRRRRRVVAANLMVFGLLLGVVELGLRATGGVETSHEFMPIELLRQVTDGGPDAKTGGDATYSGGLRTTTDQPLSDVRQVLVFGGSTTECIEVGDAETWPSALQRLLGGKSSRWRVENHGRSATTAANRATALESVRNLGRGDVVVFFVGVNDAGVSFAMRDQPVALLVGLPRLATGLQRLSAHSVLADRLFRAMVFGGVSESDEARQEAVEGFHDALDRAASYAESHGALFIPVLQPHLFTRAYPSEYDRALARVYSAQLPEAVAAIYPALWGVMSDYSQAIDARGAQDGLERSPYYDWHHVDARGNEAIARFIYDRVDWSG